MSNFCHNATHVYIADGIKYISTAILLGHSSYMQNSDIQSLRFPSTLQTIGKETFTAMPQKVRYLVIPKSVKYVGERAIGKQCLNYKLALSVYFEHETLEEINHLTLIKPWCSGLYFKDWNSCVLVKVKNEAMKNKLSTANPDHTNTEYKISVENFKSVPTADDGVSNWYTR